MTIPAAARDSMQGMIPATIATCSADGTPNVSVISQVFYVSDERLATSYQFFNKTVRNIRENPRAQIFALDPRVLDHWLFDVEFLESQTDGPIFDEMDMQLEAIASLEGMSDVFKLKAADVYRVLSVRRIPVLGPPEGHES